MAKFKPGPKGSFGERRGTNRFGGGSRDRGRGGFGGGGRGFGRGGDRGGFGGGERSRGPVEMHDVICDKCGKNCEVPFKPSGNKPVLCSDCFRQNDRGSDRPSSRFSDRGRSFPSSNQASGASSEQLKQINEKLDKILKVLQELEMADEDSEDEEEDDSEEVDKEGK
jgi:CxxC-x17-CxxC domain-containing protein